MDEVRVVRVRILQRRGMGSKSLSELQRKSAELNPATLGKIR